MTIVMRACEGCRRRKIKCDAATTNTWPCSACIRLRLHCVRPNGQFDGTSDGDYETSPSASDYAAVPMQDNFRQMPMGQQQPPMMANAPKAGPAMYAAQAVYPDNPSVYQPAVAYSESPTAQQNYHYSTASGPLPVMGGQQYDQAHHMPSPPHHLSKDSASPELYSHDDSYQQQDLSDLLGSLKVDEAGSGKQHQACRSRPQTNSSSTLPEEQGLFPARGGACHRGGRRIQNHPTAHDSHTWT